MPLCARACDATTASATPSRGPGCIRHGTRSRHYWRSKAICEAEEVYRDDLGLSGRIQRCTQHPDNVWSLHGLVECLQRRGDNQELAGLHAKLDDALAKVDVPITSSCMCRAKVYTPSSPDRCCCS